MAPFDELRPRAEKGDSKAQLALALLYEKPMTPEFDLVKAAEWLRKAADQDLDEAQYQLGLNFQFGHGVEKDCAQAVNWLRKAADHGHASAAIQLGSIYLQGAGIEKDCAEAIKWFRKAADRGNTPAQYTLGTLYAAGQGVKRDDTEAVKWLRKAADQGHDAAQYALGGMYAERRGVDKDDTKALEWFRKAADQGYAAAQSNLRRWSPVPDQHSDKGNPSWHGQDLGAILKTMQHEIRILGIDRVHVGDLSLRLVAVVCRKFQFPAPCEIVCFNTVDYSIRPKNPATIEGGPVIEFHEKHPLLESGPLQLVPGGDGEVFRPPLNLKLLILDQSYVIAERFEIRECVDNRPRSRITQ